MYQQLRESSGNEQGFTSPLGYDVGNGVRVVGTLTDFGQGVTQETGNTSDVAIEGKGFFMVHLPSGQVGFTRNGAFTIDKNGYLVNSDGYKVLSSQGNDSTGIIGVSVGSKSMKYVKPDTASNTISISEDGYITTEKAIASPPILELANFANPSGLSPLGGSIYLDTAASGVAACGQPTQLGVGALKQGFLEGSNVKVVEEMVKMIIAQRAYEINSKSIQASDDMMSMTNSIKR
jgi:flagellar basal-body rod protein FlgG